MLSLSYQRTKLDDSFSNDALFSHPPCFWGTKSLGKGNKGIFNISIYNINQVKVILNCLQSAGFYTHNPLNSWFLIFDINSRTNLPVTNFWLIIFSKFLKFIVIPGKTFCFLKNGNKDNRIYKLILESFCASCATTGYTTEVGCDYPGNDIWSNHSSTESFTSCLIKCDKTDSCVTAMWNNSNKKCYTKHGNSKRICTYPPFTVGRSCEDVPECSPTKGMRINF